MAAAGGRYALGDLLGRGGMADVYLAHDQVLDRDVAVKLLRERASEPGERDRFIAEARILARLNHPNLVAILDAGTADDHPYLVLELVNGTSLSTVVNASDQGLAPERVIELGAQIAAALAHCHALGVVHRDVKPANILIDSADRALLTDFGISRLLDATTRHTQTGSTIGTAGYLAPEQVYGEEITPAVDLYALGLVLLEACTGHREYTGTPVEAAVARLHRSPRIPAGLPPVLSSVISRLTRTDPTERPLAADVSRELGALGLAPAPIAPLIAPAVDPLEVATAAHQLHASRRRARRGWSLSAAAAGVVLALGCGLLWHGEAGAGTDHAPATAAPVKVAAERQVPSKAASPAGKVTPSPAPVRPVSDSTTTPPKARHHSAHLGAKAGAPRPRKPGKAHAGPGPKKRAAGGRGHHPAHPKHPGKRP